MAALRAMPGPLCTVSVCGRARQGKSFLLNQMLGRFTGVDRPKGFVVSPTQQSCTRGIWMWSAPIQVPGPDGRKCNTVRVVGARAVDAGMPGCQQPKRTHTHAHTCTHARSRAAVHAHAADRMCCVHDLRAGASRSC
jgi:hypothetical protein